MQLNTKAMTGVHVKTKSGTAIGKVASFDLDANTGHLSVLHVKTTRLVPGLMDDEVFVPWSAIVSMSEEEVVIQDGVVEESRATLKNFASRATPQLAKEQYGDLG